MKTNLNVKAMDDCEFGKIQLTESFVNAVIELAKQSTAVMVAAHGNPECWTYTKAKIGDMGDANWLSFECGDAADEGEPAGISVWVKTGYEDNDPELPEVFTRIA